MASIIPQLDNLGGSAMVNVAEGCNIVKQAEMNAVTPFDLGKDINIIKLAREVAIDHYPINEILARYGIPHHIWDELEVWPRFVELVEIERQNWNSATNTNQRIKLKSATLIEESMEKLYDALHGNETLNSKIELIKILGKFAGLDAPSQTIGEVAGRVTINIKIGETQFAFDGDGSDMIESVVVDEEDPDVVEY